MTYPQGINLRATAGYVTDGTNEYGFTSINAFSGVYPVTTAQGNTVGWEQAMGNNRDRSTTVDRRLAGVHFHASQSDFRFDLPSAGSYNVRVAAGDAGANVTSASISLVDGTTVLTSLVSGATTTGNFRDATNTLRTAAAWPGSNVAVNATFASTICRFRVGASSTTAHLYVEAAGGGGPQSLSVTPAGGISLGGAAAVVRQAIRTASGGLTISGTAPAARRASRTASGGLAIGGSASSSRGAVRAPQGGIQLSGTAPVQQNSATQSRTVTPAGGITLSGAALVARKMVYQPVGGLHMGGTAGYSNSGFVAQLLPRMRRRARPRVFPTSR